MKKKNILQVGFIITISILTIAGTGVYVYQKKDRNLSQTSQVKEDDDVKEIEGEKEEYKEEYKEFEGNLIKAKIPKDWELIEYKDGDTPSEHPTLMEADYIGLTGMSINNSSGQSIFEMNALSGFGGKPNCDEIYKFDDTSQDYVDNQVEIAKEWNEKMIEPTPIPNYEPDVIDFGNEYSEFEFAGIEVRRVDNRLYWDHTDDETFDPACGMAGMIFSPSELSFALKQRNYERYNVTSCIYLKIYQMMIWRSWIK